MDLSGTWRAVAADEDLRRELPSPDLDDGGWAEVQVPGHWRSSGAFADSDGPLLYRRRFELPRPDGGRRTWLTFDGLFYQGDVWLDGSYLGDTEGYFFPHTFEITDAAAARDDHVVAVEVTCSRPTDPTAKRNLTGVFQHWDCLDPAWNPGGIWRPVRVEETGPVRIERLRTACTDATGRRATLAFRATVDAVDATTVVLRTTVGDVDHELEHPLAAGENRVEWRVTIEQPALWWPRALGDQPLHDVEVQVRTPGGEVSDRRTFRTGLRQVRIDRWVLRVNGERLFLKGSNQGPARMDLAAATDAELAGDVRWAVDANLDLLRLHAHVTRPAFYDAADAAGLLVWQDMPLQWGYARGIRRQAARQAREAVALLGHHPSIVLWCGHNEPFTRQPAPHAARRPGPPSLVRRAIAQQVPTWNKTVLDTTIRRALTRADGTRPVVPHSGVFPHLGSRGTDTHLYLGWYHGEERDLPRVLRAVPRLARFVSEFGAQAVPADAGFLEPERWPDLDWDRLSTHHSLQKEVFERYVPPGGHDTFAGWRDATQAYQATVIRQYVETLRRLKYRPAGGFAQFCFADAHPAVTWSVLDHRRSPKEGYHALAAACAPVVVVADRPPAVVVPGDALALDVHVVSDLRTPLDGAVVTARLRWSGGEERWAWRGDVPADSCVRVGTVQAVVPDVGGDLALELGLEHAGATAANRYAAAITRKRGAGGRIRP